MEPQVKQAEVADAERTNFVFSDGEAVAEVDVITSARPLDPRDFPGWLIAPVGIGWVAVRLTT